MSSNSFRSSQLGVDPYELVRELSVFTFVYTAIISALIIVVTTSILQTAATRSGPTISKATPGHGRLCILVA